MSRVAANNSGGKRAISSGQLGKLAGVSPDTIRLYERKGLLAANRSLSGYRYFNADAPARVRLIRSAPAIGFSIEELARILRVRDSGGVPCSEVRRLASGKLAELEARIGELSAWHDRLKTVLLEWELSLKRAGRGKRAGLIGILRGRKS